MGPARRPSDLIARCEPARSLLSWLPPVRGQRLGMDETQIRRDRMMWGVVLGVGGAFAITAWYADNPVLALVIAVITVAATLVVYARAR